MTLPDFIVSLRNDTRFFANTTEEFIDFLRVIGKKADAALPPLFGSFPSFSTCSSPLLIVLC